jgi:carbon-monoxide dehydrogenase medium subunit
MDQRSAKGDAMKAGAFDYHRPTSLAEAVRLLGALEDARPIAGGQSLGPMMNLRVAQPAHLVDLAGLPELVGVEESEGYIRIGAMTTQRALERSPLVARFCPLISAALRFVGHQQTRNRGTLGGSLCHLDPAAELPLVALALDARLTIAGPEGSREMPFADLPAGYLATTLAQDEIVTHVSFPKASPISLYAFNEFARRHGDFAIVAVAVVLDMAPAGAVAHARIALGGIDAAPVRASRAEAALIGAPPDPGRIAQALDALSDFEFVGDHLYTAEYRRHLARVLTERAIATALAAGREPRS